VPTRRVNGDGLVREATECRQWLRVPVRVPIARIDLEHVAVVLRHRAAGTLLGLLAREPRAPRRGAVRTAGDDAHGLPARDRPAWVTIE
jgi:hypothetical protein